MLPAVTWPIGLPISFFTAPSVGLGGITWGSLVAYNLAHFVLGYYICYSAGVKVTEAVLWLSLAMEGRRAMAEPGHWKADVLGLVDPVTMTGEAKFMEAGPVGYSGPARRAGGFVEAGPVGCSDPA